MKKCSKAVPRQSLHFHDSILQQEWGTWFASVHAERSQEQWLTEVFGPAAGVKQCFRRIA